MAANGVDSLHVAIGGLAEYYRLAPDWWIFKLISGVRGDKEKSWKYAIFNAPLVDDKRHFTIITPEMSKGKEKSEEITVNY